MIELIFKIFFFILSLFLRPLVFLSPKNVKLLLYRCKIQGLGSEKPAKTSGRSIPSLTVFHKKKPKMLLNTNLGVYLGRAPHLYTFCPKAKTVSIY